MSSPGIRPRPRSNKPAAGPIGKAVSQQSLRVLSEDGNARAAVPSIAMPRAKTELSELLAGDNMLCLRRRTPAAAPRPNAEARSGTSGACAEPQAESPAAPQGQQSPDGRRAAPPAPAVDGDLTCVIDAWPRLPRNIRAAVLAMIRETMAGDA